MKKQILIILALILLVSCGNRVRNTLPCELRITKEKDYGGFPRVLVMYKIKGKINEEKLKDYPIKAPIDCSIQKWINFDDLNNEDKERIIDVIKEIIEQIGWSDKQESQKINSIFTDNRTFYFSGYFSYPKSHEPYRFYDFFYMLDIENNKLYSFKYLRGY